MSRLVAFVSILVLLFGCIPTPSHAAVLFLDPPVVQVKPHSTFQIDLVIDTQTEDINALEGKLHFPADLLTVKEIRDGGSIINFWVEHPEIQESVVSFSGIIPGGYQFPRGNVLSFVFESKTNGDGQVTIDEARVLRNDGKGTSVALSLAPMAFHIAENVETVTPSVGDIQDHDIPELFTPVVAKDPLIFDGKWFLSFATQDKGSGIARYEVRESAWWGSGSWRTASSPYVLKRQDPARPIFVKAIDRAGNERVVQTTPIGTRTYPYEIFVAVGILLVGTITILFLRKRRASSKNRSVVR